jgi:hypothetical protein
MPNLCNNNINNNSVRNSVNNNFYIRERNGQWMEMDSKSIEL